ncbi:transposase [Armatimonas sp.]|uniref:transposase n=1 Tax=Armatimonas sp. TaxID=1872638 RepID=UPI0034D97202
MERVYDSDLTDAQWLLIQPYFPERDPSKAGRPREFEIRSILNAIFYISKTVLMKMLHHRA